MKLTFVLCVEQKPIKQGEKDVRGDIKSSVIPDDEHDPYRRSIKQTMKKLSGPYAAFDMYHPLQDTIDLYNEIWYDSSSSDDF